MFSIENWDGLAKLGKYKTNSKIMYTPNLFPVIDPYQQDIEIERIEKDFKFTQVITSTYLMTKRYKEKDLGEVRDIHEYLNYDGIVMMDSGAYQMMLYKDIELGKIETLNKQVLAKPEIGVIMDYPITYSLSYSNAKSRTKQTLSNLKASIDFFKTNQESKISWTLPIQGGKYLNILSDYLEQTSKEDILQYFKFYALGSVVPILINQDYDTLVKMIAITRKNLPVSYPLHLFGAGHPAMFALAVFLGCDTFDSAAYALMAREGRYMTIDGTSRLEDLSDLPCYCKICSTYSAKEIKNEEENIQKKLLAEHNLWVSSGEIKTIQNAIRENKLWDLVQNRASSVPNLGHATRLAVEFVSTGSLKDLYIQGMPVNSNRARRLSRKSDLIRPEYQKISKEILELLKIRKLERIYVILHDLRASIYNTIPELTIQKIKLNENSVICILIPALGLIPYELIDLFPIGQITSELNLSIENYKAGIATLEYLNQSRTLEFHLIIPEELDQAILNDLYSKFHYMNFHSSKKPVSMLIKLCNQLENV